MNGIGYPHRRADNDRLLFYGARTITRLLNSQPTFVVVVMPLCGPAVSEHMRGTNLRSTDPLLSR